MNENVAIFIVGFVLSVLIGIVAFLSQKLLNHILSEIKDMRKDLIHVNESQVKMRAVIQGLPCRNEGLGARHCHAARG